MLKFVAAEIVVCVFIALTATAGIAPVSAAAAAGAIHH